jgi:hypothetical protein
MLEQRRWWQAGSSVWGPCSHNENGTNDRYTLQSYGAFVVGFLVAASIFPIVSMSAAGWLGVGMLWFPVVGTAMAVCLGTVVAIAARTALPYFTRHHGNSGYLNSRVGDYLATLGVMAQSAVIGFFTGAIMGKAIEHVAKKEGVARWVGGTFAAIAMGATGQKLYEWSAPEEIYRLNNIPLKKSLPTWKKVRRAVIGCLVTATVLTGIATAIVFTYGAATFVLAPVALAGAVTGGLGGYFVSFKRKHIFTAGPTTSVEDRHMQESAINKFRGVLANLDAGNLPTYKVDNQHSSIWHVSFKRNLHETQPFLILPVNLGRLPVVHKKMLQTLLDPKFLKTDTKAHAAAEGIYRNIVQAFSSVNHARAERGNLTAQLATATQTLEKARTNLVQKLRSQGHVIIENLIDNPRYLDQFVTISSQALIDAYHALLTNHLVAQRRFEYFRELDAPVVKPRQCLNILPSKSHRNHWNFIFSSALPATAQGAQPTEDFTIYKHRLCLDDLSLSSLLELQRAETTNAQAQSYLTPNLMLHPDGVIAPEIITAAATPLAQLLKDIINPEAAQKKPSTIKRLRHFFSPKTARQTDDDTVQRELTSGVLVAATGHMAAIIGIPGHAPATPEPRRFSTLHRWAGNIADALRMHAPDDTGSIVSTEAGRSELSRASISTATIIAPAAAAVVASQAVTPAVSHVAHLAAERASAAVKVRDARRRHFPWTQRTNSQPAVTLATA